MRSLKRARVLARACRRKIGSSKNELLERVIKYLEDEHGIELISTNSKFLQDGHALLKPADGCLYYDRKYDGDLTAKLKVILHELGHLEQHERLKRLCSDPDPVYGSMYATAGTGALARYNPRAQEEAEANAFATEFLCPQDEAFQLWQIQPGISASEIADHFGVSLHIVHVQLAEALFWFAGDGANEIKEKRFSGFDYDNSQFTAATFTGAPTLICAGPGTGKTATLVKRVEFLLGECKAEPESLLVLTFSNEAVQELEERIADRFGEQIATRIRISTFHGFGVTFLHHHGQFAGVDANAPILDEFGQGELISDILGKADCDKILKLRKPTDTIKQIIEHINYLKNHLHTPESLAAAIEQWELTEDDRRNQAARQFLQVFRLYEKEKAARQRVDLADLIALPISILENQTKLVSRYRQKYKFIMVDEYQDVSRSVATLLRHLCGPQNPPWVVGDARQAIYRFLGAAVENVEDFEADFPGGKRFELNTNYRSCREVVLTANQLASLMDGRSEDRWLTASSNPVPLGASTVSVSLAASDHDEYSGIAGQINDWLEQGVAPGEVAVLARRNVDVRNLVLALGRLGIKAVTAGLATPEGAAGDLASIVTFADRPQTSLPRVTIALGRGRYEPSTINSVIRWIHDTAGDEWQFTVQGDSESDQLAAEVLRVWQELLPYKSNGDAFTQMCAFLFDASDYLRRILALPAGADRSLSLGEITTSLSKAAIWRISHRDMPRPQSRRSFGEYFRDSLNVATPSLIPPPATTDAVRVMTCHAAKGLEFPFVAVVGQTLSKAKRKHQWLPPSLQPSEEEDIRQSDSLFFVGATRAQRGLIVSFANTASGTARARDRIITPLLDRWHTNYPVKKVNLPQTVIEREQTEVSDIWGGTPRVAMAVSSLDRGRCAIKTYLTDFLGARFPLNERPLYPAFFQTVRRAMERMIREFSGRGAGISQSQALGIFATEWAVNQIEGHQHYQIYFTAGQKYVEQFAQAIRSLPPAVEYLEAELADDQSDLKLRLDLVALYRTATGAVIAVLFRPESYLEDARGGNLLWSKVDNPYRIAFVLMRQREPCLQPYVFSGEDGVLYPFLWSRNKGSDEEEARRSDERYNLFSKRLFRQQINHWNCERCEVRLLCPHWLEADAK